MYKILSALLIGLLLPCSTVFASQDLDCPAPSDVVVINESPVPLPAYPWVGPQMQGSQGPGAGTGGQTVGNFLGPVESSDHTSWMCLYGSSHYATLAEAYARINEVPMQVRPFLPKLANLNGTIGMLIYKKS